MSSRKIERVSGIDEIEIKFLRVAIFRLDSYQIFGWKLKI